MKRIICPSLSFFIFVPAYCCLEGHIEDASRITSPLLVFTLSKSTPAAVPVECHHKVLGLLILKVVILIPLRPTCPLVITLSLWVEPRVVITGYSDL